MVKYRRNKIPGGTWFFTLTLQDRKSQLLTDHIDLLRTAFHKARSRRPFTIDAIVILPDHLHTLWTLPSGDADFSNRWWYIKSSFTRALRDAGRPLHRNHRGEYNIWQRRFWEHTIRDDADMQHHIDYIHFNPVKHGHVEQAADWPFSSFHRYVRKGVLPQNWAGVSDTNQHEFGE